MRKLLAGFLLCAVAVQTVPLPAQSRAQGEPRRISDTAAALIASTWMSDSLTLELLGTRSAMVSMPRQPLGPPPKPPADATTHVPFAASFRAATLLGTPGVPPPFARLPLTPQQAMHLGPAPHSSVRQLRSGTVRTQAVSLGAATTTGINPWWEYEEGPIPGIGKDMLNVANGNLIVQSDDIDVPERGIDLAFRRTYNSQSSYDYAMSDGSVTPAQYGAHWTNNFDAHIAPYGTDGSISVFDIDGTRYDYRSNGTACLSAPEGQHATLCYDGVGAYNWTKKTGTIYDFWVPTQPANAAGYAGRLIAVYGRNWNNNVKLTYSWSGDASTGDHLTQIVVTHADGHALTLTFSAAPSGHRLLQNIQEPDGATYISYGYDTSDNLTAVTLPRNSSDPNQVRQEQYGYYATNHQLYFAAPPRWTVAGNAGGYAFFAYDASGRVANVAHYGVMNYSPADGTNQPLQPGAAHADGSGYEDWYNTLTYGSGVTSITDSDGHWVNRSYDALGRVTQVQTGASVTLTTYQGWDSHNNIISSTDARGNETDYAYDGNGNTLWVQQPQVSANGGTGRPVARYAYDAQNNLIAYCDPQYVWTSGIQDCSNAPSATRYHWDTSDSSEPYGRLTDTYTPLGYHTHITYDPASMHGLQVGVPTTVQGDGYSQLDGTTRTPTQALTYDGYGNVSTVSNRSGTWTYSYDSLNRLARAFDSDAGNPGTCYSYFANGQVSAVETAAEHAFYSSSSCTTPGQMAERFAYDANGNLFQDLTHFGSASDGTKQMFYDGADRLIEEVEPQDRAHDAFTYPWAMRYLYDLSQGQSVSFGGTSYGSATYAAHGSLYKVQKYIGGPIYTGLNGGSPQWSDISGTGYDALDRETVRYNFQPGGNLVHWSMAYDASPGLLKNMTTPVGDTITPTFDALGRVTSVQYGVSSASASTPNKTLTYDADGRITQVISSAFGSMSYAYDAEGKIQSQTEALGGSGIPEFTGSGGWNANTTLTYSYYPDGLRKQTGVASSLMNEPSFEKNSYRNDGLPSSRAYMYQGSAYNFAWQYSSAGRLTAKSDPLASPALTIGYDNGGRIATYGLPEGSYGSFSYDPEGEPTGYTFSSAQAGNTPVTLAYSTRGELVSNGSQVAQSADGYLYVPGGHRCFSWGGRGQFNSCGATTSTFDGRMNANLGTPYTPDPGNITPPSSVLAQTLGYDASMRMTTGFKHDVEDHDVSESGTNSFGSRSTTNMGWGPNGHPTISQTGNTHYLHWSGDQILYSTTSYPSDMVEDVKLGGLADLFPGDSAGTLQIWDRDFTGVAIANRNSSGQGNTSLWAYGADCSSTIAMPATASAAYTAPSAGDSSTCSTRGPLVQARTDGYFNGMYFVNGVRSYYSGAGSWTSPDALGGDSPFSYANNNAVTLADPTGLSPGYCGWQSDGQDTFAIFKGCSEGCFVGAADAIGPTVSCVDNAMDASFQFGLGGMSWRGDDCIGVRACSKPDYMVITISIQIPGFPIFGVGPTYAWDNCGRGYLGVAGSAGGAIAPVNGSAMAGYLYGDASRANISNFVHGLTVYGMAGAGPAHARVLSPFGDQGHKGASEIGLSTPQVGVGASYMFNFNYLRHLRGECK